LDQLQVAGSEKVAEAEPSKVILHYASMSPTPSLEIRKTELNPVSKEIIKLNEDSKQVIGLPNNSPQSGVIHYKVKAGESLYGIARTHNLSVEKLKSMNNLKSNNITPGQLLAVIPAQSCEVAPFPSTSESKTTTTVVTSAVADNKAEKTVHSKSETIIHKVKKEDTLYSLSRQYGCKVAKIKNWNKINQDLMVFVWVESPPGCFL